MRAFAVRISTEEDERIVEVGEIHLNRNIMHPRSYTIGEPTKIEIDVKRIIVSRDIDSGAPFGVDS